MPETFSILDHRDDFAGWAFMVAISDFKLARRGSGEECHLFWQDRLRDRTAEGGAVKDGPVEIELRVDGHEASFIKILERMQEENEYKVRKRAAELVRERLSQIDGTIHEWLREKSEELKNDVASMFPELDLNEER